jgi:hypothetical protein
MSKHLTEEQIARGLKRVDSTEEWLATDEHLSQCAECQERLAKAWDLKAALQHSIGAGSTQESKQAAHLTFEQLEAYVDGTLAAAEQEAVRSHIRVCSSCTEELRDLQLFKQELASSEKSADEGQPPSQAGPVLRWPVLLRVAAVIVVATVAAVAFLWIKATHPRDASIVVNKPAGNPGGNGSTAGPKPNPLAVEIGSLQPDEQRAVRQAIEQGAITLPHAVVELQGSREVLMGESASDGFQVLEPAGEAVIAVRPLFRWQPLKGAQGYSVVVFDSKLNPVETSPTLHATSWNPSHSLKQGRVYEWQVTARTADGNSIVAPAPPNPEARFLVLEKSKVDELEQFQQSHPDGHLVLGILYAQAGILQAGMSELEQISPGDANYNLAQKLLAHAKQLRSHP